MAAKKEVSRKKVRAGLLFTGPSAGERDPHRVLIGIILGFVLLISFCNVRSLDIWWHIATGEWIGSHRDIPRSDPFSHTAGGQPWVSHEWMFGLLAHGVHRLAGVTGLVAGKGLLIASMFLLSWAVARLRGAGAGPAFLVLAASYLICRFRFTERPELVSIPIAVSFLLVHELSGRRPNLILMLPPLQLLWVNVHGGTALLGWFLAGVLLAERAWTHRTSIVRGFSLATLRPVRTHLTAAMAVAAISFVNPHGHRALTYGLLRTRSPLDNREFQSLPEILRAGSDLSAPLFLLFAALLLGFAAFRPGRVRPYEYLLFPVLLLLTFVFFRFRPLFVFLLAPSLALHLSEGRMLGRLRWWVPALAGSLLLAYVSMAETGTYFYRFGAGIHPGIFPVDAARFVQQSGISGRMFNSYGIGGYLIWSLWPGRKVFVDGREDVYVGPGVLQEYVHCMDSSESWNRLVSKHEVDYAILNYPVTPPSGSGQSLEVRAFPRHRWALLYFDEVVVIYARRGRGNDELIGRSEIREVQPLQLSSYLDEIVRDPLRLQRFQEEMARNERDHPSSFRNSFALGILALKRGPAFTAEAVRQFEQTVRINPEFAPAYANLGSIYAHLGRRRDAEKALRRSLALEENPSVAAQLQLLERMR